MTRSQVMAKAASHHPMAEDRTRFGVAEADMGGCRAIDTGTSARRKAWIGGWQTPKVGAGAE